MAAGLLCVSFCASRASGKVGGGGRACAHAPHQHTNTQVACCKGHSDEALRVAWSPGGGGGSGGVLASGGAEGCVRLWRAPPAVAAPGGGDGGGDQQQPSYLGALFLRV